MPQKGKYLGVKMKDIPAKHLVWLSENDKMGKSVRHYFTQNREVLYKQAGMPLPELKGLPFAAHRVIQKR